METLVLDIGFIPVARVSWQRAITLLWEGKVEVVEEYQDKTVRSVTLEFRVPAVIRFLRLIRGKRKAIKFNRENVYTRDKGRCQYCSTPLNRPKLRLRPALSGMKRRKPFCPLSMGAECR